MLRFTWTRDRLKICDGERLVSERLVLVDTPGFFHYTSFSQRQQVLTSSYSINPAEAAFCMYFMQIYAPCCFTGLSICPENKQEIVL